MDFLNDNSRISLDSACMLLVVLKGYHIRYLLNLGVTILTFDLINLTTINQNRKKKIVVLARNCFAYFPVIFRVTIYHFHLVAIAKVYLICFATLHLP